MACNSSASLSSTVLFFQSMGMVDHFVGYPANCWALWLIVSGKQSLIESEILTVNLLIQEVFISTSFFLTVLYFRGDFGIPSPLVSFCNAVSVVGRILFQCHVCVDRYLAVVHPVVFVRYKQIRYRGVCLAAVWIVVTLSGLVNTFTQYQETLLFILSFCLLLPALSIELFCSLSIIGILRKSSPGVKGLQRKTEGNQQKLRAVKIICIVLAMLILNVVPFIVLSSFYICVKKDLLPLAFTLATTGSPIQAFLFLSRSWKGQVPSNTAPVMSGC